MKNFQDRFSNSSDKKVIIDVCSPPYNAAGDGEKNDRTAIQDAIDEVAASGGGTVLLPTGRNFLTGDLELRSNIALRIEGVLTKSNDPSHYCHPAVFGRMVPDSTLNWDLCSYYNYPLIFAASGTDNFSICGHGKIDMNYAGSDDATIHVATVGLFDCEDFVLREITIVDASQPQIWPVGCKRGEIAGVIIKDPAPRWNNEAICICNCRDMHVHHNYSICGDDNIDIWSSFKDARMRVWCSSEVPQPSVNIEVNHNIIGQIGCGAYISILPWGADAPDQQRVRIDNINIHDNTLLPFALDERPDAINNVLHRPRLSYQEWNQNSKYGHSPISNVAIHDNGIGNDTKHDGDEPRFPCVGFETNDVTDPWFTDAIIR